MATSHHSAEEGLDELRGAALSTVSVLVLTLGVLALAVIAVFPAQAGVAPLFIAAGLALTWSLTTLLRRLGVKIAGSALTLGLLGIATLGARLYPDGLFVLALGPVVTTATVIVGLHVGVITAAAASGVVLLLSAGSAPAVSADVATATLVLDWAAVVLTWALWRPVYTALAWSWNSYAQALEKTEQLRDHQVELGRVNRSLNDAYSRLEQLSLDLDAARQTAEEASRLKAEFAASISHELRTPVNLIIGFSEMMLMGPRAHSGYVATETHRGDVEAIYRNAYHLSSLVDDILDLSQVNARRMGLSRQTADLSQIVDEAFSAIATMFQDKGLSLRAELPNDLPIVRVDPARIRQVLINLLSNAARFTTEGGVTVRAGYDERDIVVSVADTGRGIAASELPFVFDEFRQVGPQGSRRHSGLGLTICKRIVELHGGSIWAESEPGHGTTFTFTLPRTENVASSLPERDWGSLTSSLQRNPDPRTVVVVDDDPDVLRIFQRYLDGYQVVGASRATELISVCETHTVRAAILTRPEDGLDVNDILERGLQSAPMPVFRCQLRTIHDAAANLGIAHYLRKPVSQERVRKALASLGRPIRRVLVADDDLDMLRLLTRTIRAEFQPCQVFRAANGSQALELMRKKQPDAVLLDLLMPELDGYGVLAEMRADERLQDISVVVITARGAEEETVLARSLEISRLGGLSVGELMGCLQSGLDLLLGSAHTGGGAETGNDRGRPAAPTS